MNQSPSLSPRPVFIIGAARSGTKFLRDLGATSPKVDVIPFDVNFLWRIGNESASSCELKVADLNPSKVRRIRSAIVHAADAKPGNVLVEKTVSNSLRIAFVKAIFPEARFVHLIRDGRSVIESVDRIWDLPTPLSYKLQKLRYYPWTNIGYAANIVANNLPWRRSKKRIWGVLYDGIDRDMQTLSRIEICAHQWVNCVTASLRDISQIPPEDVLTIRYEDLVTDQATFDSYREFLGVPDDQKMLAAYQERTRTDTQRKWVDRFAKAEIDAIGKIIDPLLQQLGYDRLASLETAKG